MEQRSATEQQHSCAHALFKRCAGCGEDLSEGAMFQCGVPMCLLCYLGDMLRLYHIQEEHHEQANPVGECDDYDPK